MAGLKRPIDSCAASRCTRLMLGGAGKPELVGPYYKVVAACCGYAESRRVALSVKPHGGANATGAKKGGFNGGPLVVECLDRADRAGLIAEAPDHGWMI